MPALARSHLGLPIVLLWTSEDSQLSRSAFAPPGAGVWSPQLRAASAGQSTSAQVPRRQVLPLLR